MGFALILLAIDESLLLFEAVKVFAICFRASQLWSCKNEQNTESQITELYPGNDLNLNSVFIVHKLQVLMSLIYICFICSPFIVSNFLLSGAFFFFFLLTCHHKARIFSCPKFPRIRNWSRKYVLH